MADPAPPANDPGRPGPRPACPICGRPSATAFRPFCSTRCADVDLQRWFSGRYVVPISESESDRDKADEE